MSRNIKPCSGADTVRKFQRAGWSAVRQKGSHVMMTRNGYQWTLSIPQHDELGPGLLAKLIKQSGLTVEEFNSL
jgi:predicted RNA binding protein YcfA (HicA-like mRNA interferase family)